MMKKDQVCKDFKDRKSQILVSTDYRSSVNVPNADYGHYGCGSFGLSQPASEGVGRGGSFPGPTVFGG